MSEHPPAVPAPAGSASLEESARLHRAAETMLWLAAAIATLLVTVDLWFASQTRVAALTGADDLTIVGMAVVGAILASRRPRNPVGWILCGIALVGGLSQFAYNFGYYEVKFAPASGSLGVLSLWMGNWIWLPPVCVGLTALTLRLPSGHVRHDLRFVDRLAIVGTGALVVAFALMPGEIDQRSMALNPMGVQGARSLLTVLRWAGYLAVGVALIVAIGSLLDRLRRSHGDEREQLKWIASAGVVAAVALIFGFVWSTLANAILYDSLVPFLVSTAVIPLAIGVAVLKYRLYEIDLIINRALVYGTLTASLAGLYALSLSLAQVLVGATGQRSAAAILLTAFVGSTTFSPAKERLQRAVDRRFAIRDPAANIDSLCAQVEVVAQVLDAQRIARRLVDELATVYRPRFVSLSLESHGQMVVFHRSGDVTGTAALAIRLHNHAQEVGELSLGERLGGVSYTARDHESLQRFADAVADAIGLWRSTQPRGSSPPA